jgi:transcription antitermination factor NusG
MERKHWLAIYSKPRWEKKVHQLLSEKGIESYCPLNRVTRQWSDRIKIVEEPLFKSYVFVRINENERTSVRMTNGVVNFVYWEGKPAIIKDREIRIIKKFLDEFDNVGVRPINLEKGTIVKVRQGALMDQRGVVKRLMKNKVEVVIESLGYALVAIIDKKKLEPFGRSNTTSQNK